MKQTKGMAFLIYKDKIASIQQIKIPKCKKEMFFIRTGIKSLLDFVKIVLLLHLTKKTVKFKLGENKIRRLICQKKSLRFILLEQKRKS